MKKYIIIYLLLFLAGITTGMAQDKQLNTYLVTAAQNNPGLKAKFSDYQAALQKVPQVGALPDPQVMFGYMVMPVETRLGPQQGRISASQSFPWFGTLNARKDAASSMAAAKLESFEQAKSKLFYDVRSTWYNIYMANKAIQRTKENLEILNSYRQVALAKIAAGLTSSVDELRLQMEIGDMENQLALLRDNERTLTVMFNNLLNTPAESPVEAPDTLATDSLDMTTSALWDSISVQNHQLKQLDNLINAWDKQELAARKAGKPSFTIGFEYVIIGQTNSAMAGNDAGKDAFAFPTVGIKIPLYRKKYEAMVREAQYHRESAGFKKQDKQNTLNTIFAKTKRDYRDAERRISLYTEQLELAKRSLRILYSDYSTGGKNFEEVLRMERRVLKYALELDKAAADRNAAAAFVTYLTGK
ncbi:MAG TPA: TolC family protein [Bacteroidales bacterium]|nr:TolC family protein [Bacteroidales bacterium]